MIGLLNADDFLAGEDVISRITDLFTKTETDGVYGELLYVKRRNGCLRQHRYWRSGNIAGRFPEWMDAAASRTLPPEKSVRAGGMF